MGGLVFVTPPAVDVSTPKTPTMDANDLESHRLSLSSGEPVNQPTLEYESWLLMTRNELLQRVGGGAECRCLLVDLEAGFQILQRHKVAEWHRQQEDMKLRERARSLISRVARPTTCPTVETGTHPPKQWGIN